MDVFLGVIVGLLVLTILVTGHEFGHFLMARRNGVRVLEFGIGFPPRAIAWVRDPKTKKWHRYKKEDWDKPQKGLIFSLNWIPIGGFCQMDGESDADTRKGTFGAASFWSKTKILLGGVLANWFMAFIIFTILAWTGMPTLLTNQFTVDVDTRVEKYPVEVAEIVEGSPADTAGFIVGDKILAIDNNVFYDASDIIAYDDEHAGEDVVFTIRRTVRVCPEDNAECSDSEKINDSFEMKLNVKLNPSEETYALGVRLTSTDDRSYSTWSAPIVGVGLTLQLTGETFQGIGNMIGSLVSGTFSQLSFDSSVREAGQEAISEVGDSVSGPVGIVGVLFPEFVSGGPAAVTFLAAIISISLACMNILPIPALDGGRWLLIAIYKIRGKKLTKETEEKIVSRAFIILIALMFIVTILDVIRIAE